MAPPKRPWFRFYVEAFADRKLRRLTPAERWLWVAVLGAARQSPEPGVLLIVEDEPMTVADLADFAGVKERDTKTGLGKMAKLGLVSTRGDGALVVTKWGERQHESDDVSARVRKHRSKSGDPPPDGTPMKRSNNGASDVPVSHQKSESEAEVLRTSSSVSSTECRGGTNDDDEPSPSVLVEAARLLGQRDHDHALADGVAVHHRPAHLVACVENRRLDPDLLRLRAEHPDWDAVRLADAVDAPPAPTAHPATVRPVCGVCIGSTVVFDEASQTAGDCPACKAGPHLKAVS